MNHGHFRNVVARKPHVDYTEVFLDDGQVDMFALTKELVRQKYARTISRNIDAPSFGSPTAARSGASIRRRRVRGGDHNAATPAHAPGAPTR